MQPSKLLVLTITTLTIFTITACAGPKDAPKMPAEPKVTTAVPAADSISKKQLDLYQAMRKLWTDHVVWTRSYIVAAVAGTEDAGAAAARLLQNQVDIGKAVAGYYGMAAGDQLVGLLKEHIMIAVDLIAAAKVDDKTKFADANTRWTKNGEEIADFLAGANPNWPKEALRDMMEKHLATTTDEVVARLGNKYEDDVKAYDTVYDHILMMSDALTEGIIKQFPEKF